MIALSEAMAVLVKALGGKRKAKKALGDVYWEMQWKIMTEEVG